MNRVNKFVLSAGILAVFSAVTFFALHAKAGSVVYPIRNIMINTLGKTIYMSENAANRDGTMTEYLSNSTTKTWKVKYEQKGHSRGICQPPVLQFSFDKYDSKGNPKELFTGVSTFGTNSSLQYQKIRMIPECDVWNEYFGPGGDVGFAGNVSANFREYMVQRIFRQYGVPVADVLGFANVTFVSSDTTLGGHTYRYMIIQRPKELDDQIPFTTQYNLDPTLYEAESTNGWSIVTGSDGSGYARSIVSQQIRNNNTNETRTVNFDPESTLRFLLLSDFLNLSDMSPLHNEDWGVSKADGLIRVIPHGFDYAFTCSPILPESNSAFRTVAALDSSIRGKYAKRIYDIAQSIFADRTTLDTMIADANSFPYPDADKARMIEYLEINFHRYAKYVTSPDFAENLGVDYVSKIALLPFASQAEFESHQTAFNQSCVRVQYPLPSDTSLTLDKVDVSNVGVSFYMRIKTGKPALQLYRFARAFSGKMVNADDNRTVLNDYGSKIVPISGVEDSAGPYYSISPNTQAVVRVDLMVDTARMIEGNYYFVLTAFQPNSLTTQSAVNFRSPTVRMGLLKPIKVTNPSEGERLNVGDKTKIVWEGTPDEHYQIFINPVGNGVAFNINSPTGYVISHEMQYDWTVGNVYIYDQHTGNFVVKKLPPGSYTIAVSYDDASTQASGGVFTIEDPNIQSAKYTLGANPILKLDWDKAGNEIKLSAVYQFTVQAGTSGVYINRYHAFSAGAHTDKYFQLPYGVDLTLNNGSASLNSDNYYIPAKSTANFNLSLAFNPKVMFAGQYSVSVDYVFVTDDNGASDNYSLGSNMTNPVTIIGEVSPYIISISPSIAPSNKTVTLLGVRFATTGNTLKLWSVSTGKVYSRTISSVKGGTYISFVPNVPADTYTVSVTDPNTGASNNVSLNVKPSESPSPSPMPVSLFRSNSDTANVWQGWSSFLNRLFGRVDK